MLFTYIRSLHLLVHPLLNRKWLDPYHLGGVDQVRWVELGVFSWGDPDAWMLRCAGNYLLIMGFPH